MSEYLGTIIVAAIIVLMVFFMSEVWIRIEKRANTYVVATVRTVMADVVTSSK